MPPKFETYAFEKDEKWLERLAAMEIPPNMDSTKKERVLLKKKHKFFQRYVDEDHVIPDLKPARPQSSSDNGSSPTPASSSTSTSTSSSTDSSSSGSTSPPRPPPSYAYGTPPRTTTPLPLGQRTKILLNYAYLIAHILRLFCVVLSVISPTYFRRVLYLSMGIAGVGVITTHGFPKLSKDYFQSVLLDETSHGLFKSIIFLLAAPSLVLLVPLAIDSLIFTCASLDVLLKMYIKALHRTCAGLLAKVLTQRGNLVESAASLEVFTLFILIFQLIVGPRQFMFFIIYLQFLQMRYAASPIARSAWARVRVQADGIFYSPKCPGFIRGLYTKVQGFLYSQVDPQRAQQMAQGGVGSMLKKCSIM